MEPFRFHLFVCTQEKPEGVACCAANGSPRVVEALKAEIARRGLSNEVQVTASGCMGLCDEGPVMVAYPEGAWYAPVRPEDVHAIVAAQVAGERPASPLPRTDTEAMKAAILDQGARRAALLKAKDAAGVLPDELHEMIRAFMPSRVVLTALELDVFSHVGQGASAAELAGRLQADTRATEMLLNALVGLKLLEKSDGTFRNAPASARYFAAGSPDDQRLALLHTAHLWRTWSTLTEAVRAGTRTAEDRPEGCLGAFTAAMDRNARERAGNVVRAVGADGARRLLDLGGGAGAYSIAFARAVPGLRAEVVDVPEVLSVTQEQIRRAGLADRVSTRSGDMLTAPLGRDHDLVLLSAVCHMFSPEQNRELFRRAHEALAVGGRLVVQDFILEPDKTAPRQAALFSLNMLVATKAGASYSEPEYAAWLREAGFREVRRVRLPGPAGLMIATR